MSVLDLNGVADPAERKRLIEQANQEMGNAGLWKVFLTIIGATIASGLFRDWGWSAIIWPGTPTSTRIYGWIVSFVIFGACAIAAYHWRRKERRAALAKILRSVRRCIGCGYPIDKSPETICPECGSTRGHS